ncbi:MAG: hypothetical protein DRJ01_03910 [Bacteroidetes bacterium]|nr:MAG: hypothetical protein DRJ01_03910 [Bacteroidota bacterium]
MDNSISSKNNNNAYFNPFPGLRPFNINESHLFFGRDGQSDEILQKLSENKFIAVIGASGSGKSSLIYCGVIPILYGGFITDAGSKWKIIKSKPGNSPVFNLSEAIIDSFNLNNDSEASDKKYIISTFLNSSSLGLVEAIKQYKSEKDENVLLIIDQFEELFRFKNSAGNANSINESIAFVNLLIEAINQSDVPIYVVITMRSDFIGECSQFQSFTRLINQSNYLVPQMTRNDLRQAILGPIAVGGAKITPFLEQQLLNDIGDNPDQLPILQHALMRTWDYWLNNHNNDTSIDIEDYNSIGRMEKALSLHANEAFDELNIDQKQICQSLFKTLTEKGSDNRGVRRPSSVREIAAIANASVKDTITVIDHFRGRGRSFIYPSIEYQINEDSIIDISHESLMRIWDKLTIWVKEENESIQMYRRLADAAEKYQEGKTGLWRPPDLQLALNWKEKQKPTLAWAQRYNPAFERTMVYLQTSKKDYEAEEENKIKLQKRQLRRTRVFALVLGIASIISLGFMLYSVVMKQESDTNRVLAEKQTVLANKNFKEAKQQKAIAQDKEKEAIKQKSIAQLKEKEAKRSAKYALYQKEIANRKSIEADKQRKLALESEKVALKQKTIAEEASKKAFSLRMLSISQSMSVKSAQIDNDNNLKALVAYKAYLLNKKYKGIEQNPDVYNGLYLASKAFASNNINVFNKHNNPIKGLVYNNFNNTLYSTSTDGKIISYETTDTSSFIIIHQNNTINRSLAISHDGKTLACGTNDAQIQIFNTANKNDTNFVVINNHKGAVLSLFFTKDNNSIVSSSSDKSVIITNLSTQKSTTIANDIMVKGLTTNNTEKSIAGFTNKGELIIWDKRKNYSYEKFVAVTNKDNTVSLINTSDSVNLKTDISHDNLNVVRYNENGTKLAMGDIKGKVFLLDVASNTITVLQGQNARINDIQFSPDNKFIATASSDGTTQLWEMDNLNNQPIVLKDNDAWILKLAFTSDSKYLYTAYSDGLIQRWATKPIIIADEVVSKIERNMTHDEWNKYVGADIEYEKIKLDLP